LLGQRADDSAMLGHLGFQLVTHHGELTLGLLCTLLGRVELTL
jgi:hypothetical protein